MELNPEAISKVIGSQIKYYEHVIHRSETGTVLMAGDGIVRASGLADCMYGELLEFEDGTLGMALNLEESSVSAVLFGAGLGICEGQTVTRTGRVVSVPVGEALIGRVVDAVGRPIDGEGTIETEEYRPVESRAPGICDREPVREPLETGIKAIDSMIPIGKGQRELIIGDRQTGKTSLAIDAIMNQKGRDVICPCGGADRKGGHGLYNFGCGHRIGSQLPPVHCPVCGLCHGGIFYVQGKAGADCL